MLRELLVEKDVWENALDNLLMASKAQLWTRGAEMSLEAGLKFETLIVNCVIDRRHLADAVQITLKLCVLCVRGLSLVSLLQIISLVVMLRRLLCCFFAPLWHKMSLIRRLRQFVSHYVGVIFLFELIE